MEIQLNSTKIENLNISGGDVFIKNKKVLVNSDIIREYPPDDEIWYTSVNNTRQDPNIEDFGASTIISHTYENGRGVIKFDEPLTTIGDGVYGANWEITSIYIPSGVTSIGESAFEDCFALTDVYMMPNVAPEIPNYYVFGYYGSVPDLNIWVPSGESFWSYANHEYWQFYAMNLKESGTLVTDKNIKTIHGSSLIGSGDITLTASDVGAIGKNSNGYVAENIIPSSTSYSLGTTSKKWGNVYSTQFFGDLFGSADKVRLTGGTTTGSEPMLYLVGATEQGAPAKVQKKVELNTLGMLSGGVPHWGVAYESESSSLIIGDLSKESDNYLSLGPNKIDARKLNIECLDSIEINQYNGSSKFHLEGGTTLYTEGLNYTCDGDIMLDMRDNTFRLLAYDSVESYFIFDKKGVNISTEGATYNLSLHDGQFDVTSNETSIYSNNFKVDQGGCYAIAFYETSDEKLKDFSDDITVDFNKLKEIRKSYFTWKDGDQNLHIGTSAQDIQKIYPELVSESKDDILTVDYAKLSLVALAAIDKLDERLSKIENIINKED